MDQIVIHILKLMRGFNYYQDRMKHIDDIIEWCMSIIYENNKDRLSKGMPKVIRYYKEAKEANKLGFLRSINNQFDKNYHQRTHLMISDLDDAIDIMTAALSNKTREDVLAYLSRVFPKSGYKDI